MELIDAIKLRHSVRSYTTASVSDVIMEKLSELVAEINGESGLNIQIVTGEPNAFGGFITHYGKFSNVTNYFALVGAKGSNLQESAGYYGERLVLAVQCLGLNTCWVALTYKKVKTAFVVKENEQLVSLITFGYGSTQGTFRKSKTFAEVSRVNGVVPDWFRSGVEAALLAPTAINQQRFVLSLLDGNKVSVRSGMGAYTKIDLGIIRYHFEIGAGKENFEWN